MVKELHSAQIFLRNRPVNCLTLTTKNEQAAFPRLLFDIYPTVLNFFALHKKLMPGEWQKTLLSNLKSRDIGMQHASLCVIIIGASVILNQTHHLRK